MNCYYAIQLKVLIIGMQEVNYLNSWNKRIFKEQLMFLIDQQQSFLVLLYNEK